MRLIVFLCSLMTTISAARSAEPVFFSMFNGTDLTGWHVDCVAADRSKECFKVEDGVLVLDAVAPAADIWLTCETAVTDFILKLKFRAYRDATGNSGIQFRDSYVNNTYPRHGFDIASNVPQSTGFIWDYQEKWLPYAMSGYKESNFTGHLPAGWEYRWSDDADPWNTYEVSAVGSRVKTVLNGKTIVDWDGGAKILPSGSLAIQAHGGQTFRIDFKDIELADLSASAGHSGRSGYAVPDKSEARYVRLDGTRAGSGEPGILIAVNRHAGTTGMRKILNIN